ARRGSARTASAPAMASAWDRVSPAPRQGGASSPPQIRPQLRRALPSPEPMPSRREPYLSRQPPCPSPGPLSAEAQDRCASRDRGCRQAVLKLTGLCSFWVRNDHLDPVLVSYNPKIEPVVAVHPTLPDIGHSTVFLCL